MARRAYAALIALTRLDWIVDQLHLHPSHDVLEIGGAHGVAASLVLRRLTTGRYVGVDRSAKMVDASRRRNAAAVADGRARFIEGGVLDLDRSVGGVSFDRIFAARVAALARERELATLARHLRPGGTITVSFDAPGADRTARLTADATAAAGAVGLEHVATVEASVDGSLVVCLTLGSTSGPGPAH